VLVIRVSYGADTLPCLWPRLLEAVARRTRRCLRYAVQLSGILTEDTRWFGWVTRDLESVLNVLLAGRVVLIGAK
jgi:hypothetical protein